MWLLFVIFPPFFFQFHPSILHTNNTCRCEVFYKQSSFLWIRWKTWQLEAIFGLFIKFILFWNYEGIFYIQREWWTEDLPQRFFLFIVDQVANYLIFVAHPCSSLWKLKSYWKSFFINWCETIGPIFNQTWQTLQGIDKNKAIWSFFVWIYSIHLQILVNLHSIVIIYNINKQDVYKAKFKIVGGLPDRIDVWYCHQEVPVTIGVLECISSKSNSEITFALYSRLWDWSISWLWRKKIVVWC